MIARMVAPSNPLSANSSPAASNNLDFVASCAIPGPQVRSEPAIQTVVLIYCMKHSSHGKGNCTEFSEKFVFRRGLMGGHLPSQEGHNFDQSADLVVGFPRIS